MSAHASQAFSIAHCTDSEDLPSYGDSRAYAHAVLLGYSLVLGAGADVVYLMSVISDVSTRNVSQYFSTVSTVGKSSESVQCAMLKAPVIAHCTNSEDFPIAILEK